jgi:pimeloyl-ACP methyl ester carboxylesterase
VQIRIYGDASLPTLIYLPGLHGDWTLIGRFRKAVAERVRFVELTYPRTLTWTLEDYAAGVEAALGEREIHSGWLLGESFSSQVVWLLAQRKGFRSQGVILAGGFVRHPMQRVLVLGERLFGRRLLVAVTRILFSPAKLARYRHRHKPEVLAALEEFLARRTALDFDAAYHRLHLLAHNDPAALVRQIAVPVFALSGRFDPVVPWFWVRRWLQGNCASLCEYKIIRRASHAVLITGAEAAAEQILQWMAQGEAGQV